MESLSVRAAVVALIFILIGCTTVPDKAASSTEKTAGTSAPVVQASRVSSFQAPPDPNYVENPHSEFYADTPVCTGNSFSLKDLIVGELRVSNNDLTAIASTLSLMGYEVLDLHSPVPFQSAFSCDDLPLIVIPRQSSGASSSISDMSSGAMGQGQDNQVGYPGASQYGNNPTHITPLGNSDASEVDRFLVYYHPSQEKAFKKLNWIVANRLDVASAQVYIETMVLEVREEDSEEFGLEYSKADGDKLITLGGLIPGGNTIDFVRDTLTDPFSGEKIYQPGFGKRLKLKALIDEGKAEVVSRPSILAVSNRQAVIQIVDVIQSPEISSTLSESGGLQVSAYQFSPLLIGITLNLKPRVSADRRWLTLEIDATVESEDDENSGQVFASSVGGEPVLLAEKQGSSSKKVRTFARIPDRTPIIIGGLVSRTKEEREGKFPMLNRIPGIGKLFTSKDNEVQNREIIIVLTPYILDESQIGIRDNKPKESVSSKNSESTLFER